MIAIIVLLVTGTPAIEAIPVILAAIVAHALTLWHGYSAPASSREAASGF